MAIVLLDAATATGAGGSTPQMNGLPKEHTVQVAVTGSPTAVTVDLEGNITGSTWFTLANHVFTAAEITAQAALFHVVNKPAKFVRANLQTLTAGTSPTVTVTYASKDFFGQ